MSLSELPPYVKQSDGIKVVFCVFFRLKALDKKKTAHSPQFLALNTQALFSHDPLTSEL
jgi:hypothetical protein